MEYFLSLVCFGLFAVVGTLADTPLGLIAIDNQFFLDKHNEFRKAAQAADMRIMTWNNTIAEFSQTVADKCLFEHSRGSGYGENLYASSGVSEDGAVKSWHDEINNYNFNQHSCSGVCGHYTQVVWAKSYKLGCAATRCSGRSGFLGGNDFTYVVCNYSPPGNFQGVRPYTTGTPCSACDANDYCYQGLCANIEEDGVNFQETTPTASTAGSTTDPPSPSTTSSTTDSPNTSSPTSISTSTYSSTGSTDPSSTSSTTEYPSPSTTDSTPITSTPDTPTACPNQGCSKPCEVSAEKYDEAMKKWRDAMSLWRKNMDEYRSCNQ